MPTVKSTSAPSSVKVGKRWKSFLIVGVAVIVLGTVGFFVWGVDAIRNVTSNPISTTDISNWNTYENQIYGFSIKYPDIFSLNTTVVDKDHPISFDTFQHNYMHGGVIPKGQMEFSIFSQPAPVDLDKFIDSELGTIEKIDTVIDGRKGKLIKFEGGDGPDLPGSELIAYVIDGNLLWKIQMDLAYDSIGPQVSSMFDQILSGFKFTASKN